MDKKKGTQLEVREVPMFLRDHSDYELGDEMWQAVMTHNIVVKLLRTEPLNKEDMSFLQIQNDHLKK
ncbi:MAG: hypothetical protein ACTSWQ_03170 [Candidatus Thorarchaeota archaeon]